MKASLSPLSFQGPKPSCPHILWAHQNISSNPTICSPPPHLDRPPPVTSGTTVNEPPGRSSAFTEFCMIIASKLAKQIQPNQSPLFIISCSGFLCKTHGSCDGLNRTLLVRLQALTLSTAFGPTVSQPCWPPYALPCSSLGFSRHQGALPSAPTPLSLISSLLFPSPEATPQTFVL